MKNSILIFVTFSVFTACKNEAKPPQKKETVVDAKSLPDPTVKRYIGLLSHGTKGTFFRPCGKENTLWAVEDASGEAATRYKKVYKYGYDNQSVMAFVEASLLGKNDKNVIPSHVAVIASDSVASEGIDNTLKISKIEKLEQKDWDGYCFGFEFVIFGSKPFWAVEISPKEGYIDFNDEKHVRYHHFRYVKPEIEGETRTYRTGSFDGTETLKIVIKKQPCRDKSNPKPYPFCGEVTLNETVYKGCAQW
jgi:uncharacterized membrane protein